MVATCCCAQVGRQSPPLCQDIGRGGRPNIRRQHCWNCWRVHNQVPCLYSHMKTRGSCCWDWNNLKSSLLWFCLRSQNDFRDLFTRSKQVCFGFRLVAWFLRFGEHAMHKWPKHTKMIYHILYCNWLSLSALPAIHRCRESLCLQSRAQCLGQ